MTFGGPRNELNQQRVVACSSGPKSKIAWKSSEVTNACTYCTTTKIYLDLSLLKANVLKKVGSYAMPKDNSQIFCFRTQCIKHSKQNTIHMPSIKTENQSYAKVDNIWILKCTSSTPFQEYVSSVKISESKVRYTTIHHEASVFKLVVHLPDERSF